MPVHPLSPDPRRCGRIRQDGAGLCKSGQNGAWPENMASVVDTDEADGADGADGAESPNNTDYAKARGKGPPFPRAAM